MSGKKIRRSLEMKRIVSFFDFIRRHECVCVDDKICTKQVAWDPIQDTPLNTVSHVRARGSARRRDHYYNCVPMCNKCHREFEDRWTKEERMTFMPQAEQLTKEFFNAKGKQ